MYVGSKKFIYIFTENVPSKIKGSIHSRVRQSGNFIMFIPLIYFKYRVHINVYLYICLFKIKMWVSITNEHIFISSKTVLKQTFPINK